MGCPCKLTSAFLASLGATVSARMHRDPYGEFSRDVWLTHFDEEERILVPLLRRNGLGAEADRIIAEHRFFRSRPSWDFQDIKRHARFEDDAVLELMRRMGISQTQVEQWRSQ